jgi:hypothetical protein
MEEMESITLLSKCLHKTIEPARLEGLLEVRALTIDRSMLTYFLDFNEAKRIVKRLEYLPLAID